jgi:hypothetical protein
MIRKGKMGGWVLEDTVNLSSFSCILNGSKIRGVIIFIAELGTDLGWHHRSEVRKTMPQLSVQFWAAESGTYGIAASPITIQK